MNCYYMLEFYTVTSKLLFFDKDHKLEFEILVLDENQTMPSN